MTVLDNIMIAPRMVKGMKDEDILPIAEQLLKKVGLWENATCIHPVYLVVSNNV